MSERRTAQQVFYLRIRKNFAYVLEFEQIYGTI